MVRINSETVYSVELSSTDIEQLESGEDLSFDLPSGDSIRLVTDDSTTDEVTVERDPDEDVDPEEIEELVKEGQQETEGLEGSPVPDDKQGGSGNGATGGMIDIERGGDD